jgi:hypothetical protein
VLSNSQYDEGGVFSGSATIFDDANRTPVLSYSVSSNDMQAIAWPKVATKAIHGFRFVFMSIMQIFLNPIPITIACFYSEPLRPALGGVGQG